MRKFLIGTYLIFSLCSMLSAQGVIGKKAVVKLGVINGFRMPLNDLQFEYAVSKKVSFTAGYSLLSSKIRPEYRLAYAYNFLNTTGASNLDTYGYTPSQINFVFPSQISSDAYIYDEPDVFSSPARLNVQSSVWSLGFRKYKNAVLSAPYGRYYSLEFFRGTQKVSGNVQMPIPSVSDFNSWSSNSYYIKDQKIVKIADRQINTTSFQMNFGKQWVMFDVLTVDFSWGFSYSMTRAQNRQRDGYIASILARNNGANFGAFPASRWNTVDSSIQ
jgi:hypothetical protein